MDYFWLFLKGEGFNSSSIEGENWIRRRRCISTSICNNNVYDNMSNYSEVARHAGVYASVCTGAARACVRACVRVPRRGNHVRGWYSGQTRVRGGGGSRQQFYNCRRSRCSARFDDLSLGIITKRFFCWNKIKKKKKTIANTSDD